MYQRMRFTRTTQCLDFLIEAMIAGEPIEFIDDENVFQDFGPVDAFKGQRLVTCKIYEVSFDHAPVKGVIFRGERISDRQPLKGWMEWATYSGRIGFAADDLPNWNHKLEGMAGVKWERLQPGTLLGQDPQLIFADEQALILKFPKTQPQDGSIRQMPNGIDKNRELAIKLETLNVFGPPNGKYFLTGITAQKEPVIVDTFNQMLWVYP